MRTSVPAACAFAFALALAACGDSQPTSRTSRVGHYETPVTHGLPDKARPGGATTFVSLKPGTALSADAFSQPAANLTSSRRGLFAVGNSFFTSPWVSAPASVVARDGLGPLYTAAACQDCHIRDGRGHLPPSADQPVRAAVVRIARADGSPDPVYGSHLQVAALPGLAPEARVRVRWLSETRLLPDGVSVELRRPTFLVDRWAYGPPAPDLVISMRIAPPMIGLGLLEAIPEEALTSAHGGRFNRVHAQSDNQTTIGRFGWKASQPDVHQQTLDALLNDLGITSSMFRQGPCTKAQRACSERPSGGDPELEPAVEEALVFYARHLAVPARRDHERPEVIEGERLFERIGCANCHQPRWNTGVIEARPELSNQIIYPYTDLQLHDMGPDLADGIHEHGAGGSDWRTPPLWGLGHTHTVSGAGAGFLHDGRARDLAEAILWHGGEAAASRDAWAGLSAVERRKVIRFLASL
jgi:CxxC motif-containing protein (DUF1111 family)